MPIKYGEIQDAQFYVEQNGELKPIGYISECELTADPEITTPEYEKYLRSESMEFTATITSNLRAFYIFITTGNDLYLRFPKKLRRKRKKPVNFTRVD